MIKGSRPMRILHVTPYYHPAAGGAEHHVRVLSELLAARGHTVMVVTQRRHDPLARRAKGELPNRERIGNVEVRRFEPNESVPRILERFLKLPGSWRLLSRFLTRDQVGMAVDGPWSARMLLDAARFRPDIVAVMNWSCPGLAFEFARLKRLLRFRLVGIPLFHTAETWSAADMYPDLLGRCDAVLANTDYERKFIEERTARPVAVHTVGVGVDGARLAVADGARIRERYRIGRAPVVGYVGRLQPVKGVTKLIEAMTQVWASVPECRVLLAGRRFEGASRADSAVETALSRLAPDERTRIIHINDFGDEDKASIFDAMDVFAMPSTAESFGIAYLEAWMRRKPVIGARIGSTACVVEDGKDGLLVDPNSADEIAGAIVALMRDRERRRHMGEAGYAKTRTRYRWERVVEVVEGIYADLAGIGPTEIAVSSKSEAEPGALTGSTRPWGA